MEINNRKSISDELQKYCINSNSNSDFIELTEWTNGEGVDIVINYNGNDKILSLSYDELDAIIYLKMSLMHNYDTTTKS